MLRDYPRHILGVKIPKSTLHELFIDVRVRWSSLKGYLRVYG